MPVFVEAYLIQTNKYLPRDLFLLKAHLPLLDLGFGISSQYLSTPQYLMRLSSQQPSEEAGFRDSCFAERHQKVGLLLHYL